MPTELARRFRAELEALRAALHAVPRELAATPWRVGGWTRKEIVGHMMDSAANNRQRFVRAASEGRYSGPKYAQEAWVAAHGYANRPWETLLGWWAVEHEILAAVVDGIEEAQLGASCVVGEDAPVTLRFLIEDYIDHQKWHLAQITAGTSLE
ncbi:MAG: DinB family protein [Terracidiphilus sp.]